MDTTWSFDNSLGFFAFKESYIPLTRKQEEKLIEIWNEERLVFLKEELDMQGNYQSGFLTKENMLNRLFEIQQNIFSNVQNRFEQEYWITPIKTKNINIVREEK